MTHVLVGLAIGDALGAPFETQHFTSTLLAGWCGEYLGSSFHGTKAGEGTDDTLMTLALAEVLTAGPYNAAAAAARYAEVYRQYPNRGWGKATTSALEKIEDGYPWTRTGSHSEGNGSAMRAAPFGLAYSPDAAARVAREDAAITHDTHEAREGSAAVAIAIAELRVEPQQSPTQVVHRVLSRLAPSQVRDRLKKILHDSWESPLQMLITMGTGAHVVETVPAALGTLLVAKSFKEAITCAIQAGGDTDTVAAITGAVWGAIEAPPELWLRDLHAGTRERAQDLEKRILSHD